MLRCWLSGRAYHLQYIHIDMQTDRYTQRGKKRQCDIIYSDMNARLAPARQQTKRMSKYSKACERRGAQSVGFQTLVAILGTRVAVASVLRLELRCI